MRRLCLLIVCYNRLNRIKVNKYLVQCSAVKRKNCVSVVGAVPFLLRATIKEKAADGVQHLIAAIIRIQIRI